MDYSDANITLRINDVITSYSIHYTKLYEYDVDKILGVSKKERSTLTEIYEILKDLGSIKDLIPYDDILEASGMNETVLKEAIKKLITNGDIDEPKIAMYRII